MVDKIPVVKKLLSNTVGRLNDRVNIHIVHNDITAEHVDAITNAANTLLRHGAGVAGAIQRKGGSQVRLESQAWI